MFKLKKIMTTTAVAAVMALGAAVTPTGSSAATCQFGTLAEFTATADVYTSTACEGQIVGNDAIGNDSGANVDLNNNANFPGGLFGSTNWSLDTKSNVSKSGNPSVFSFDAANPAGRLSATLDSTDALSGSWAVTNWTGVEKAALILKGGNGFAAYLLDLNAGLSGAWVTQALINNGGNQPALSHISLYTTPLAPVPLPAAGILLIGALGGLGFAARRRRRAS